MKLRVKLLYFFTILLFILAVAALSVLTFMEPGKKSGNLLKLSTTNFFNDWSKPQKSVQTARHTSLVADNHVSTAKRSGYDELSQRIFRTVEDMILAVLPEGSVFVPDNSLKLFSGNCTAVSGTAAVPGNAKRQEKHFRCTVKVYFLPDGSCEAAFPEFSEITQE